MLPGFPIPCDLDTHPIPAKSNNPASFNALIVGAGFSGLYQPLCLHDRLGWSARLLEAGAGGGRSLGR